MGPAPVAAGFDELDHGVPCIGPRGERFAVAHLILERREEGFGHGVSVAVAGTAAGQAHVVRLRPFRQEPAGVLRTAIGMEDRVSRHVAPGLGHGQGIDCDIGGHALGKRPAHHHPGVQVDHRREEEPSLAGSQVGDSAHELSGGDGAGEVSDVE